jgi:assimilatory nitrate reductase catalytic subunit
MFQAAADGEIRALWIACTNPAQSMPDQATVRRALERAEFVVVQEAFAGTATCAFADLLLPATTWGEKEGTVTNSERRISRVRAAVPPSGEARHDWTIAADFARRLAGRLGRGAALFPYHTPESVWNEHRETTRGRDLDITGMDYAMLEAAPQQWPLPAGATQGKPRLYEDGRFATADGRARFAAAPYQPVAEPRDGRYPFSLNTGRLRDQWHGMSRTGTLGRLFGHVPEPTVQMHAQDMARQQLAEGDLVYLTSRRGSIVVPVAASADLGASQAFIAMHWGPEYLGGRSSTGTALAGVNALTTPAHCPVSKQPELKHTAVKILKAELPWSLLAMAWLPEDQALRVRAQLRALADALPFVSCVPFGGTGTGTGRTGVLLRAAGHEAPDSSLLAQIEQLLGLSGSDTLRYADPRRGQRRAVRLQRDGAAAHVVGVLLAGDTRAEAWIRALLQDQLPAQDFGRQLLSFQAKAPAGVQSRGKVVCSCFGVSESAIRDRLSQCSGSGEQRLAALQGALQCGTNCGSCVPELKRMVRATEALA